MTTGIYQTEIVIPYRGVDQDIEINVHYEDVPAERGSTDGPGGPPLEPSYPAHIEITHCETVEDGHEIVLSDKQERHICEQIAEHLDDADNFARSEHADAMREAREEMEW